LLRKRVVAVNKTAATGRVQSLTTTDGTTFTAAVFVDASYEGDLMALAGVTYTWGREAPSAYNESYAGVRQQPEPLCPAVVQFDVRVNSTSNGGSLLPLIAPRSKPPRSADRTVQAYNYRLCLTQNRSNWAPIPPPKRGSLYAQPETWELLRRLVKARAAVGRATTVADALAIHPTLHGKCDINDMGPIGTDLLGGSSPYADGNWTVRDGVVDAHLQYTRGLIHFYMHDASLPAATRRNMSSWGLCKDEWISTDNWPPQLYVRETRRMVGTYVMTQHDRMPAGGQLTKPDSVGLGSYGFDNHNHQRIVTGDWVYNEGNINTNILGWKEHPFELPYRAIVPKAADATNLLVTCCFSATHIAYGSIRLEPQLMMLGEAAGTAAVLTLASRTEHTRWLIADQEQQAAAEHAPAHDAAHHLHLPLYPLQGSATTSSPVQRVDVNMLQHALRGAVRTYPNFRAVLHESQMVADTQSTNC
jgi:hypothetical protein